MSLFAPVVGTTAVSGAANISITPPTGIRADDIVLAFVAQKPSAALGGGITPPAGWSLVDQSLASSDIAGWGTILGADTGAMTLAVYRWNTPVANSTTPVTFTITQPNSQWGFIVRIPTSSGGTAQSLTRRTITSAVTGLGYSPGGYSPGTAVQLSWPVFTQDPTLRFDHPAGGTTSRAGDLLLWAFAIPTDAQTPNQFSGHFAAADYSGYQDVVELNEPDTGLGSDSGGFSAYTFCGTGRELFSGDFGYPDDTYFLDQFVPAGNQAVLDNTAGPAILVRVREELATLDNRPDTAFFAPTLSGHPLITKPVGGGPNDVAVSNSGYAPGNIQLNAHDIGVLIVQFKSLPGLTGGYAYDSAFWGAAPVLSVSGGGYGGTIDDNNGDSTIHVYTVRPSTSTINYGAIFFDANVQIGWARLYNIPYRGGLVGGLPLPFSVAVGYGSSNSSQLFEYSLALTTSAPGQTSLFQAGDSVIFGMSATSDAAEYADDLFKLTAQGASFGPFEASPYDVVATNTSAKILGKYVTTKVQIGSYTTVGTPVNFTAVPTLEGQYHRGPVFFIRLRTAAPDVGQIRSPETVPQDNKFFAPIVDGGITPVILNNPIAGAVAYSVRNGGIVSPAYPAGVAIANRGVFLMFVGSKPTIENEPVSTTTPTGWTVLDSNIAKGGYGTTLGRDTGNTNLVVYRKDTVVGTETGTVPVDLFFNEITWAVIIYVPSTSTPPSGLTFSTAAGQQEVNPTISPMSVVLSSLGNHQAGDVVLWAMSIATDNQTPSQFTNHFISRGGVSYSAVTEFNEPDSNVGFQIGGFTAWARVNTGLSVGFPTVGATVLTSSTNVRGPVLMVRVREQNTIWPQLVPTTTAFFAPTITQTAGVQSISPVLLTNTSTLYAPTVTSTVSRAPALLTNTSTFYAPAVVARIDLFAQPQALAAASAALSTSIRLSGSAAVQASAQAALSTSIRLVGATAQSLASTTADLDARIRMSGSGGVVSAATAALTVDDPYIDISWIGIQFNQNAGRLLQSSVSASASVSANLDVARRFVASVSATAVSSASLTTLITPQAGVSGLATAASSLTTSIRLAASGTAETNRVLAMLNTGIVLAGAASGRASAAVVLTVSPRFYSNALAAATASAALNTSIRLTATPQAVTTTTAGLAAANRFYASPLVQATASAALSTQIRLATSAAALAAAAGNFSAAPRFYAAATSVAATQAVLDARIRLVGAVSATVTAAASLNARITAQASAQASALASADLSVSQRVDANVSVTATAGASLTTSIKLAAVALSQAQTQAGLTVVKPLFASVMAESSVVGDLKLTARFEASVAVVSTTYSAVLFVISANLGPPSGGGALARDNRQMIVARDFLRPRVQKDTPKILVPISTVAMLVDLDNNSMVVRQDTTVRVLPERSIVVVPKVNA